MPPDPPDLTRTRELVIASAMWAVVCQVLGTEHLAGQIRDIEAALVEWDSEHESALVARIRELEAALRATEDVPRFSVTSLEPE